MLKYPWKRDSLIAYLKELSDENYQKNVWGTNSNGIYYNVMNAYDFIIEDENLNVEAQQCCGYYLYENEWKDVETFAQKFRAFMKHIPNVYDNEAVTNNKNWPDIVRSAKNLLHNLLLNNEDV